MRKKGSRKAARLAGEISRIRNQLDCRAIAKSVPLEPIETRMVARKVNGKVLIEEKRFIVVPEEPYQFFLSENLE